MHGSKSCITALHVKKRKRDIFVGFWSRMAVTSLPLQMHDVVYLLLKGRGPNDSHLHWQTSLNAHVSPETGFFLPILTIGLYTAARHRQQTYHSPLAWKVFTDSYLIINVTLSKIIWDPSNI